MAIDPKSIEPIYVQIAYWLENKILDEVFKEQDKVPSQYTLADMFNINPATAAKGLTLLDEEKIVYGRRGLGKFVSPDAKKMIREKRQHERLKPLINQLITEANHLEITEDLLIKKIKTAYQKAGEQNE